MATSALQQARGRRHPPVPPPKEAPETAAPMAMDCKVRLPELSWAPSGRSERPAPATAAALRSGSATCTTRRRAASAL